MLLVFVMISCTQETSQPQSEHSATIHAMDTVMDITIYGDKSLLSDAEALIYSIESELSSTLEESDISRLNREGSCTVSADTAELISYALNICDRTNGALDISVYPVMLAWGFTTSKYRVPSPDEISNLLQIVDYHNVSLQDNTVTLSNNSKIDLGSIAKGYTGDRLLALFREHGVKSALINLGGNVQCIGTKPDGSKWRIAISNPDGSGYAGILEIADCAVITSGGYERYFEKNGVRYHHIFDPKTGYPASGDIISVTIIASSGILADSLSTALFVMGSEKAVELWRASDDFEAVMILSDGKILITNGIQDDFIPYDAYIDAEIEVLYHN